MTQCILFMTVGTGYGSDGYKNLASGLHTSIKHNRPDKVVFFVTDKSTKTVDYLKELYNEEEKEILAFEEVPIINPDDFNNCFETMSNVINKYVGSDIVIDYTSGTKTMSVTIAVIAIINKYNITSITGKRSNLGIVKTSTEENKTQNPYQVYDLLNYESFKKHFNNNRFESALDSLSKIILLFDDETIEALHDFTKMYIGWDKFHHSKPSFDYKNELFDNIRGQLQLNIKCMNILSYDGYELYPYYLLADLFNNAKRRYQEGKYDDATARLYRLLELIAQIRLKEKYSIKTSNIDMEILEKYELNEEYIEDLEKRRSEGKIKLGLNESYKLLNNLNDDLGIYYMENEKDYRNILNIRNSSILAHGNNPVPKDKYIEFEEMILDIARVLRSNIDSMIEECKFPKFVI